MSCGCGGSQQGQQQGSSRVRVPRESVRSAPASGPLADRGLYWDGPAKKAGVQRSPAK